MMSILIFHCPLFYSYGVEWFLLHMDKGINIHLVYAGFRVVNVVFWLCLLGEKLGQRWGDIEGNSKCIHFFLPFFWTEFELHLSQVIFCFVFTNFCYCVLQSGFEHLKDFPLPFWLALFVEGTRFTQAKLLAAQEYAASAGLPIPRNVLVPRTKVKILLHFFAMS